MAGQPISAVAPIPSAMSPGGKRTVKLVLGSDVVDRLHKLKTLGRIATLGGYVDRLLRTALVLHDHDDQPGMVQVESAKQLARDHLQTMHASKRRLLEACTDGARTTGELADELDLSESTIQHHVRDLRDGGWLQESAIVTNGNQAGPYYATTILADATLSGEAQRDG